MKLITSKDIGSDTISSCLHPNGQNIAIVSSPEQSRYWTSFNSSFTDFNYVFSPNILRIQNIYNKVDIYDNSKSYSVGLNFAIFPIGNDGMVVFDISGRYLVTGTSSGYQSYNHIYTEGSWNNIGVWSIE